MGKKTENVKMKRSLSIAVKLVVMLLILILISVISNIVNMRQMTSMNKVTTDITENKIRDIDCISTIVTNIESVQKAFYLYVAIPDTDSQQAALEEYTRARQEISSEFQNFASYTTNEEDHQKLLGFASMVEETLDKMDSCMSLYRGTSEFNDALAEVNAGIEAIAGNVEGMQAQSFASVEASKATADETFATAKSVCSILIIISIVLGLLITAYIILGVVVPLKKTANGLHKVIKGIEKEEGNLTVRLESKTNDEVGQIVWNINRFMEVLQGIIGKIKYNAGNLQESTDKTNVDAHGASDQVNDTSATMQELSASMEEVSESVSKINHHVAEIQEDIEDMSSHTSNTTAYVGELSTRADDMKNSTMKSQQSAANMTEQIADALNRSIENSKEVEKINELTNDILSIASKTNLLALNASIEAARAGEAGKGFAVVADEIRILADNSRETANGIGQISQSVTSSVTELAENARKMLDFVYVDIMKDYENMVKTSDIYQQDSAKISDMMEELERLTQKVCENLDQISTATSGVMTTVQESTDAVGNVAEYTQRLAENITNISTSMESNLEIADVLNGEVKAFTQV